MGGLKGHGPLRLAFRAREGGGGEFSFHLVF